MTEEYHRLAPIDVTPERAAALDALFGDVTVPFEDTVTNERLAHELLAYICPAGEPWTADTPEQDHGHTQCMWIGLAIQRLRAFP